MLKRPLTYNEQIERLKEHGVVIEDHGAAVSMLRSVSYYRLSGYLLQFRKSASDSDLREPVNFRLICDLYDFDQKLRGLLKDYLEIAEVYYKNIIVTQFSLAHCLLPPHDQHYDLKYYHFREKAGELILSIASFPENYRELLWEKALPQ